VSIPYNKNSLPKFTQRQGQFLAYIFYYTKINKRPPAESDIQNYFEISSASTHQILKGLVSKQLLEKVPKQPRSMRVLISQDQLPTEW